MGQEGPHLGRLPLSGSVRIRILCRGARAEFQAGFQWTQKTRVLLKDRWAPKHIFCCPRAAFAGNLRRPALRAGSQSLFSWGLHPPGHLCSFAKT